jgi:transcriptional regulator with XRE-family HTH domain
MKSQLDIKKLIKKGFISDELEFERASVLLRKLRLPAKEDKELNMLRLELKQLIIDFENTHWNPENKVSDIQLKESDYASLIAEQERVFLLNRKEHIKQRLTEFGLSQQEFGAILGHGKTYISQLMNGVYPFSNKDLIIIHRLFDIKLEYLILTILPTEERLRINDTISKIKITKKQTSLKLKKMDLLKAV